MSAPLEVLLREAGIACRVEARERLVVLIPDASNAILQPVHRRRALELARAEGFTHVAIELNAGAAVPRD